MKRITLLFLTAMLCFSLCSCDTLLQKAKSAITGEEIPQMPEDYVATLQNDQYEYELYETYVKIIKYLGTDIVVTIPEKIDGKPVTVIGSFCFNSTEAKVTNVTIHNGITEIEEGAFYLAQNLISIEIPDSVTKMGSRAFAWCTSLESVSLGGGISEIPEYCFNSCSSLTSLSIPANVVKIGLRAFSYCEKLAELAVPAAVESVGERAFESCPALLYVIFENDTLSLGNELFSNTPNVVIIAAEGSSAMNYCSEYSLRWSTSKDIEAVILGGDESSGSELSGGNASEVSQ